MPFDASSSTELADYQSVHSNGSGYHTTQWGSKATTDYITNIQLLKQQRQSQYMQSSEASDTDEIEPIVRQLIDSAIQRAIHQIELDDVTPEPSSPLTHPQPPPPLAAAVTPTPSPEPIDLTQDDCIQLMSYWYTSYCYNPSYQRTTAEAYNISQRIHRLLAEDYVVQPIDNFQCELCTSYPPQIFILEAEKPATNASTNPQRINDSHQLLQLFQTSRFSRVHGRFAVPVILVNGMNICRSSTLSIQAEAMFNSVHSKARNLLNVFYSNAAPAGRTTQQPTAASEPTSKSAAVQDSQRGADEQLLLTLGVRYICDLMVELKKRMYGVTLTSSEKVEHERYRDFLIHVLPYPGCEHFADYRQRGHNAEDLHFNWTQSFINAELSLANEQSQAAATTAPPTDASASLQPSIEAALSYATTLAEHWKQYRQWDLVRPTQNYLLLLLQGVNNQTQQRSADASTPANSLLLHCVSGWDRTPLFISIMRMTLWADGVIHQSLNATQMLYLTLAYDWCFFGHQFIDRLNKGEDICFFAFDFLQYITDDKYAVQNANHRYADDTSDKSTAHVDNATNEATATDEIQPPNTKPSPIHDACSCSLPDDDAAFETSFDQDIVQPTANLLLSANDDYFDHSGKLPEFEYKRQESGHSQQASKVSALSTSLKKSSSLLNNINGNTSALSNNVASQSAPTPAPLTRTVDDSDVTLLTQATTPTSSSNAIDIPQPTHRQRAASISHSPSHTHASNHIHAQATSSYVNAGSWQRVGWNYNSKQQTTAVSLAKSLSQHSKLNHQRSDSPSINKPSPIIGSTSSPSFSSRPHSSRHQHIEGSKTRHNSTRSTVGHMYDEDEVQLNFRYANPRHDSERSISTSISLTSSPSTNHHSNLHMEESFITLSPAISAYKTPATSEVQPSTDDVAMLDLHNSSLAAPTAVPAEIGARHDSSVGGRSLLSYNYPQPLAVSSPDASTKPAYSPSNSTQHPPPRTPTVRAQRLLDLRKQFLHVYAQAIPAMYHVTHTNNDQTVTSSTTSSAAQSAQSCDALFSSPIMLSAFADGQPMTPMSAAATPSAAAVGTPALSAIAPTSTGPPIPVATSQTSSNGVQSPTPAAARMRSKSGDQQLDAEVATTLLLDRAASADRSTTITSRTNATAATAAASTTSSVFSWLPFT